MSRNLARETISYTVAIKGHEEAMKVLQAAKLVDAEVELRSLPVEERKRLKREWNKRGLMEIGYQEAETA